MIFRHGSDRTIDENPVEAELKAWFSAQALGQRELLEAVESEWADRLRAIGPDVRAAAASIIRKHITSKKILQRRDAFITSIIS